MRREVDLKEISDGRLYGANDLVKADCQDCIGCSDCCRGMGSSIILDPMDLWRITGYTGMGFSELLDTYLEMNLVDGVILPNLKLDGKGEACAFLNREGRCGIHPARPGICRLFPLGRIYEEDGFKYFLQIHECTRKERSKIKVKKWLQIDNIRAYEAYILAWHNTLKACERVQKELTDEERKVFLLYILKVFYQTPFESEDFYGEFYLRLEQVKVNLGIEI